MTDLLDIAPATAYDVVHTSDGRRVKLRGLHGNDIAAIASRFPNLIALFAAAGDNVVLLISSFGAAIGPIIAAGCDQLGNEAQEQAAGRFLFEDQVKMVKGHLRSDIPKRNSLVHGDDGEFRRDRGKHKNQSPLQDIAIGITALIRNGFSLDDAMRLTPRQIAAYLDLSERLDALDRAGNLMVNAVAAQGDQKALDKMSKQLISQWRSGSVSKPT